MSRGTRDRLGLTYVEVVISMVIVSLALVAGLQAFGSYALGARLWQEQSVAEELAADLLAEINIWPYRDPLGSTTIGRESGESNAKRESFDDIDDYHQWSASPPQFRNGQVMNEYQGYTRSIQVEYDNSGAYDLGLASGLIKKITVQVAKDDKILARRVAIRGDHLAHEAWPPTLAPSDQDQLFRAMINFQPSDEPTDPGYLMDSGELFGDRGNGYVYGWSLPNHNTIIWGSELSPSMLHDTMIRMTSSAGRTWQIVVPDGQYQVYLVAGDPSQESQSYFIKIENTTIINGSAVAPDYWIDGSVQVQVADGLLSLVSGSSTVSNNICYIEIYQTN